MVEDSKYKEEWKVTGKPHLMAQECVLFVDCSIFETFAWRFLMVLWALFWDSSIIWLAASMWNLYYANISGNFMQFLMCVAMAFTIGVILVNNVCSAKWIQNENLYGLHWMLWSLSLFLKLRWSLPGSTGAVGSRGHACGVHWYIPWQEGIHGAKQVMLKT